MLGKCYTGIQYFFEGVHYSVVFHFIPTPLLKARIRMEREGRGAGDNRYLQHNYSKHNINHIINTCNVFCHHRHLETWTIN